MDKQIVLVMVHLVGFALGLGGATISDVMFFRSLRDKQLSSTEYATMKILSTVVWIGLLLLIASGLFLFYEIYKSNNNSLPLLGSPRWQTKLTLVGLVLVNGLVFMKAVFPMIKKLAGKPLSPAKMGGRLWLFSATGTVSILSWYFILVISVLPRTFRPPYWQFMAVYAALLILGIIFSRFILSRRLK